MTTPCRHMRDKIADYLLGVLQRDDVDDLETHIRECPRCRQYAEALHRDKDSLLQLGEHLGKQMDAREAKVIEALSHVAHETRTLRAIAIGRSVMRTHITRFAAAAVILVALGLAVTMIDRGVTPVYALAQSLDANHTIETIHLLMSRSEHGIEASEFTESWVKYDGAGIVSNFRLNRHQPDEVSHAVWNSGVLETWMPARNVLIVIRANDAGQHWQRFAEKYDPRLVLQRLYESRGDEGIEVTIDEPVGDGDPIHVQAINSTDSTRLELVVDPETKLVTQLSRYRLAEQEGEEDELIMRIEYLAYNQPIDPSTFDLGGIPDDALVYDQVDQLVGLEKGDLTDNDIAIKVVREGLEATIARDYAEVSRLMEGDPGDTIEAFLDLRFGARLTRVISLGQTTPHEGWPNILCVPSEIEVENEEKGRWVVNITATAKAIGYQPGHRWIMHTDLKADAEDAAAARATNLRGCIEGKIIVPGVGVGDYTIGMSRDDVLHRLLEPHLVFYERERYTVDTAPGRHYMSFGDLSFLVDEGAVASITVLRPTHTLANGLGVGDSEQNVKQAFGNDFRLHETEWKDFLTYEDKGVTFEINKQDRTVMEIEVFRSEGG